MKPPVIAYHPQAYSAVETAVLAEFQNGASQVVLDLDTVDSLDANGVRGLISLLRRSRAVGGELALRSSRPEVLRTLSVTALDRIFAVVEAQAA
jgi:anti-anti-sigma factor